jgi:hypothetical protein
MLPYGAAELSARFINMTPTGDFGPANAFTD